jgi:hypothetical protein
MMREIRGGRTKTKRSRRTKSVMAKRVADLAIQLATAVQPPKQTPDDASGASEKDDEALRVIARR